ncbi:tetratricopeptide repeat protein [Streptomyces acidiscabies]|uniref:tetratricopeptide repeat protein n=1 Tax=Streptomyces acidiscabies TaxID=42234 RepID=UPI000952FFCC|nr:tetratricopeptide repeat protein [Streptomyces acidiscabies]
MDTAELDGRYRRLAPDHRRLYRVLGALPVADTDPGTAGAACSLLPEAAATGLAVLADAGLLQVLGPGPARPHRYGWDPRVRDHARRWFREGEHPAAVNAAVLRTAAWLLRIATCAQIRLTPSQAALHSMRGLPPLAGQVPFGAADASAAVGWLASQAPNMTGILRAANELTWDRTWQLVSAWWPLFQLQPPPRRLWEEAHTIGLHAAHRAADQAAVRQMLLARAMGLRAAGHPDEAAAVCIQVAEQARYYAAHRDHGQALLELGRCHHHRGRFEQAEESVAVALTVWDGVPCPRGTALAHLTLADIALTRQQPAKAGQLTGTALDILRTEGTPHDTARALALHARTHLHTRRDDEALTHLTEAAALFTTGGAVRWHARTLSLQGDVHRRQGHDDDARTCYREAARLSTGRWPEADHYNRQASDTGRPPAHSR